MSLKSFTEAYIECAIWSSSDWNHMVNDNPEPLDKNYSASDLSREARDKMHADCKDFYDAHNETWADGWTDEQAGHDFWLTRNRHGAGFWDRYYRDGDPNVKVGEDLTDAAHAYGEVDLYTADGEIHHG